METFNLILGIINTIGLFFVIWILFRYNQYVSRLEKEIDQIDMRVETNEIVLKESIKEDYLEPGKNLKVKKAKIPKQHN